MGKRNNNGGKLYSERIRVYVARLSHSHRDPVPCFFFPSFPAHAARLFSITPAERSLAYSRQVQQFHLIFQTTSVFNPPSTSHRASYACWLGTDTLSTFAPSFITCSLPPSPSLSHSFPRTSPSPAPAAVQVPENIEPRYRSLSDTREEGVRGWIEGKGRVP